MMGEGAETPNPNTGRKEGICAVPSDPRGRGGGHTWLNPPPLPCCSHPSAHSSAPRTRAHTCAQLPPALFTGHGQSRTRAAARFHQALKAKIIGCRTNLGNGVCDKANKKSSILQPPPPLPPPPPLRSAPGMGAIRALLYLPCNFTIRVAPTAREVCP